MANKVLILGDTGSGKTSSVNALNPKSTFIICPDEKELPFRGWKKDYKTTYQTDSSSKLDLAKTNFYKTTSTKVVCNLLTKISEEMPHIKVVLIDTITSLMIGEYMRRIKEKGFEKFTDIASDTYNLLQMLDGLRDDLTVVVTSHTEDNYDSEGVLRTSFKVPGGKLIGGNIKVEGMFTTVLYSEVLMKSQIPTFWFMTQNNGKNTCKSPAGMFDDIRIPNDLSKVLSKISEYENDSKE